MNNLNNVLIILLIGLIFFLLNNQNPLLETFDQSQCPNSLIKNNDAIYLKNTKLANIPGVNPLKFNNLEDYVEYTHWQRSQNMYCPVLSLQHEASDSMYKQEPPSTNLLAGITRNNTRGSIFGPVSKLLDATRNDPPYNKNSFPGVDQLNQYIGIETPLDQISQDINGLSPNPMDSNWGGGNFTQNLVNKGYYSDNNVSIKTA